MQPFRKVATQPATIEIPDLAAKPVKGKLPTKTVKVTARYERANPVTKDNPCGLSKIVIITEGDKPYIATADGRWHPLDIIPKEVAKLME